MRLSLPFGLCTLATFSSISHVASAISAQQQPIQNDRPLSESYSDRPTDGQTSHIPRIAIVGAGPAGSSTAYHLRQFSATPLNITIFDSNPYIGGRTTTVNALNDPRYPCELGASIFVDINAILYNATYDFGLPVDDRIYERTGAKYELGIWDGQGFVFLAGGEDREGKGWMGRLAGWWDLTKLFWRYGFSPVRLRNLQRSVIGRFLRMYDDIGIGNGVFPFEDLMRAAGDIDLLDATGKSGSVLLKEAGVGEAFAREIVQASSRVNYAQNLYDFQGLETMVCMSTEGAMSVYGGNWQIFDRMIKYSAAEVHLNTTVTSIETTSDGTSHITYKSSASNNDETAETTSSFDTVILAHPYNPSRLTLSPPAKPQIETPPYVTLCVTLFTTPSRPHPIFFNLGSDPSDIYHSQIPDTIITTLPKNIDPSLLGRGADGIGPLPFWSLSTLRVLNPANDSFNQIPEYLNAGSIPAESLAIDVPQYLYKIFSPEPITAELMLDLFQWDIDLEEADPSRDLTSTKNKKKDLSVLPKELVTWHYEKTWQSYPYLPPRTEFEGWDVYEDGESDMKGRVWRTAPMEVFISTMETMALAGRNVAALVIRGMDAMREKDTGEK